MYLKTYYGAVVGNKRQNSNQIGNRNQKQYPPPFKISVSGSQSKEPLDGI
jgi:hypothetical protein